METLLKTCTIILILFPGLATLSAAFAYYLVKRGKCNAHTHYPPYKLWIVYRNKLTKELKKKTA